jgi:hypothetical protein
MVRNRLLSSVPRCPPLLGWEHDQGCDPIQQPIFARIKSIFSVYSSGGWLRSILDRHPPAYFSVDSGLGPAAHDNFYAPELNSKVTAPGVTTAYLTHAERRLLNRSATLSSN